MVYPQKKYKCKACGQKFYTEEGAERHAKNSHGAN